MPKQFSKYLGYFCIKSCCREFSKIAQSGQAAGNNKVAKKLERAQARARRLGLRFGSTIQARTRSWATLSYPGPNNPFLL